MGSGKGRTGIKHQAESSGGRREKSDVINITNSANSVKVFIPVTTNTFFSSVMLRNYVLNKICIYKVELTIKPCLKSNCKEVANTDLWSMKMHHSKNLRCQGNGSITLSESVQA